MTVKKNKIKIKADIQWTLQIPKGKTVRSVKEGYLFIDM